MAFNRKSTSPTVHRLPTSKILRRTGAENWFYVGNNFSTSCVSEGDRGPIAQASKRNGLYGAVREEEATETVVTVAGAEGSALPPPPPQPETRIARAAPPPPPGPEGSSEDGTNLAFWLGGLARSALPPL
jgi:hypothetical protein